MLKIFTNEFYSIGEIASSITSRPQLRAGTGALFAAYGAGVLGVSAFRRMQGNRQFFSEVGEDGLDRKRCVQSLNITKSR